MNKNFIQFFQKLFVVCMIFAAFTNFSALKAAVVVGTIGNGTYVDYENNSSEAYGLDFNSDGFVEFTLNPGFVFSNFDAVCNNCIIMFNAANDVNNVWASGTADEGWDLIQSLTANTSIGSTGNWIALGDTYLIDNANNDNPLLPLNQDAYVGFRFKIGNNTHYGWAKVRMTGNATDGYNAEWLQCAYESTPGTPIAAGSTGVGIADHASVNYRVYPNPTTNFVTIENAEIDNVNNISVFDFSGRIVPVEAALVDGRVVLNMSNLNAGTYFIGTKDARETSMIKIIKQ